MDEKISVIMTCYNCEKTVDKAINSILDQTYENWVMIICDDGSTDNTLSIIRGYEKKYPDKFIVIQNEKNSQLPFSLNHCLEYVKTDLVARMDADDWCLPERFEKQVTFLKSHPDIDLVGTGISASDGEKEIGAFSAPEYPKKEDMLRTNCFLHATIMTYKRVYDALGGYSLDPTVLRVEDVDLWCRFFAAGFKGYNLQEKLYVILEDDSAAKRRSLRARINSVKTRRRGYKLMGLKGIKCYRCYSIILKGLIPMWLYKRMHAWKLKKRRKSSEN